MNMERGSKKINSKHINGIKRLLNKAMKKPNRH
jgi:hypothetical protein